MENLRIKYTPSQLGSFVRLLNLHFIKSFSQLHSENYVDYYNIRVTLKKCYDKIFKLDTQNLRTLHITFTPPELQSLKIILALWPLSTYPPYELIVITEFLGHVDRYENNLFLKKSVLSDNYTFNVSDTDFGRKCAEIEKERGY